MIYVVDGIPPSNNLFIGRNAPWEYREIKQLWAYLVKAAVGRNRPSKPLTRAKVTISYYFPTRGRRDPDNYAGKMLLDGLTAAGVLADDSFENVELILRGKYDKARPRTEIEVKRL